MGITMMKQSIKKALTPGSLFMGLVALIIIVYTYITQDSTNQMIGYSFFEIFSRGITFLFIIFSYELSKDTLQEEKLSKRMEWYLANEIKISTITLNHCFATFITTNILMVPIILITSFIMKEFSTADFIEYLLNTLLNSFILNVMILRTVNMNSFKSIWKKMALLNFTLLILDFLLKSILLKVTILLSKIIILSVICLILYRSITKERIVSAYY